MKNFETGIGKFLFRQSPESVREVVHAEAEKKESKEKNRIDQDTLWRHPVIQELRNTGDLQSFEKGLMRTYRELQAHPEYGQKFKDMTPNYFVEKYCDLRGTWKKIIARSGEESQLDSFATAAGKVEAMPVPPSVTERAEGNILSRKNMEKIRVACDAEGYGFVDGSLKKSALVGPGGYEGKAVGPDGKKYRISVWFPTDGSQAAFEVIGLAGKVESLSVAAENMLKEEGFKNVRKIPSGGRRIVRYRGIDRNGNECVVSVWRRQGKLVHMNL